MRQDAQEQVYLAISQMSDRLVASWPTNKDIRLFRIHIIFVSKFYGSFYNIIGMVQQLKYKSWPIFHIIATYNGRLARVNVHWNRPIEFASLGLYY
jgi:hypothetical protein